MDTRTFFEEVENKIIDNTRKGAWNFGVRDYALELLESLQEGVDGGYIDITDFASRKLIEKHLLNGADSWSQYSWGGCSSIYDEDIAKALCNPTELKQTDNGRKRPNAREEWLDVQARALRQASARVKDVVNGLYISITEGRA